MVNAVINAWGKIDTLIHAAGIAYEGTILNTDEAQWDETMNINFKGTYLVNQSVLKHRVDRGQGSIVNVASDAGLTGGRNLAACLTDKSLPLIPQPLLPRGEKGSQKVSWVQSPSPALGEGLG